ncbi:MAG: class I SAM-dependent methyltransferase [Spirulinaceae cyanobacterium SM2_1_0]|nr:class I SAM-dependent methyltransferase [Spirulinaceae cyanobacterium SM2_1_0]
MECTMKLEAVVPWGRSLAEYRAMFDLRDADLHGEILDCGGGPASFTAEHTAQGGRVLACDPLYQFSAAEITRRVEATYETILDGLRQHGDRFVWNQWATPEALGQARLATLDLFLADFPVGKAAGRYVVASLPRLPFAAGQFELALCSHLLFTYSEPFSTAFHQAALRELARIAREVRVFPLLENFSGCRSPHLEPVMVNLRTQGYAVQICPVPYEFQRGGNQMLRVYRA